MRRWLVPMALSLSVSAWAGEAVSWPELSTPPAAPSGAKPGAGDAAVLIGIEDYDKVSDIVGARQNIQDWQSWLLRTRGVPAASIVRRVDGEAVKEEIEAALREGAARVKPGGTLWVVYIGHGAPTEDGRDGMVVGADARDTPASLYARGVRRSAMMDILSGGRQASTVVLLDACFSGKGVDGGDLVSEPLAPLRAVATASEPTGFTVLTATRDNQFAGLLPGADRPAFSYLVLGALRGWGDDSGDGVVTAREASDYARGVLNLVVTGRRQEPEAAGPDVALGKGKEAGPDLAAMSVVKASAPSKPSGASSGASRSGGFGDLSLDVSAQLAEQACAAEAQRLGTAARASKLEAAAREAAAEAKAAWGKVGPQAEACLALDASAREKCAGTVDAFVSRAESLAVSLPAGVESAGTSCGERTSAFAAESRKVAVAEVSAAKALAGRLRGKAPAGEDVVSATVGTLKWIPAGSFTMGSPAGEAGRDDDEVQHRVTLSRGFVLMESEVTQGQWQAVMGENPSRFPSCGADCPVEHVSWLDAVAFANRVSAKEGLRPAYRIDGSRVTVVAGADGYRLPTEAEWEYAARGGEAHAWAGSGEVGEVAWFADNSGSTTHPACRKRRNAYGLCDMSGNVWEWVWDAYGPYGGAATDPTGAASGGALRVFRGGGWSSPRGSARVANRGRDDPAYRFGYLGFRLARSVP